MSHIKEIALIDNNISNLVTYLSNDNKELVADALNLLKEEKSISELFPKQISNIHFNQSLAQDTFGVYGSQYTSYRKLRQALLEYNNTQSALLTAKSGYKKSMIQVEKIKLEIDKLKKELEQIEDKESYDYKILELELLEKEVELEEKVREMKMSDNLVKDSLVKLSHQKKMVEKFTKETEEEGLTYEESELVYYTIRFLLDAESQIRSKGNIDAGLIQAIFQMPEPFRNHINSCIKFIKDVLKQEGLESDCVVMRYIDKMKPKKTGENEILGLNIKEYVGLIPLESK